MYLIDFWTASRGEVSVFDQYGLFAVAILTDDFYNWPHVLKNIHNVVTTYYWAIQLQWLQLRTYCYSPSLTLCIYNMVIV